MESIKVRNFKSIKNDNNTTVNLTKLTILMGEQASGKSTLAKLIYFFKSLKEEILNEILDNQNFNLNTFEQSLVQRTRKYFINMFGSTRHLDDFSLFYTIEKKSVRLTKGGMKGNLMVKFSENIKNEIANQILPLKEELSKNSPKFDDFSRRERELIINRISKILNELFSSNNQTSLFMPASRNMAVMLEHHLTDIFSKLENDQARSLHMSAADRFQSENEIIVLKFLQYLRIVKSRFKSGGDFKSLILDTKQYSPINEKSLNLIIDKSEKILKGRYGQDQYGEKIFFQSSSDSGYVYLNNASSGQQESIRILQDIFLSILDNSPVFRVYEEPESHLSPIGQKSLIESISILANHNRYNQILITTHSSYIIRVIDNLLKAKTVDKEKPNLHNSIETVIERESWIDFDKLNVYLLENGEIKYSKNDEYKSIETSLFDNISDKISGQFDELLSFQYDE